MGTSAAGAGATAAGSRVKAAGARRRSPLERLVREKPLGAIGAFVVMLLVLTALFAAQIAPYLYDAGQGAERLQGPSARHLFGTDNLGRDLFSRVVWGTRVSVAVGFGAVAVGTLLAALVGVASGYAGGLFDLVTQRLLDVWLSFPPLVLLVCLVTIATTRQTDSVASAVVIAVALGLAVAAGSARVIRSAVLTVRALPYVEAARCIGCRETRIVWRYVLPNVLATIVTLATIQLGGAILAEATLSFLGFGVRPPMPAWGSMLGGAGRQYFLVAPWLAIWPGLAISLAVFGASVLGDALRDVLDPRDSRSRQPVA